MNATPGNLPLGSYAWRRVERFGGGKEGETQVKVVTLGFSGAALGRRSLQAVVRQPRWRVVTDDV